MFLHDCFEKKPMGTVEVTVVIVLYLDFHDFQIKIQRDGCHVMQWVLSYQSREFVASNIF